MTCIRVSEGILLTVSREFKPGDQAPQGYIEWHDWAEVQYKSGLRQKECSSCSKWKFPQELSTRVVNQKLINKRGKEVNLILTFCLKCEGENK